MGGRQEDSVTVITGAGSGIGAATARRFASEGACLILGDCNVKAVSELAAELRSRGCRAVAQPVDVVDRADILELIAEATASYGRLDVLVNCAGISSLSVPEGTPVEGAWERVLAVNLVGTMLACRAAVDAMRSSGGGAIVNVASIMALRVHPHTLGLSDGFNPYPPSKGGVVQLSRDLGVQLAREGIRVNAVCPGFIETPLIERLTTDPTLYRAIADRHPMGRLGTADEVARVIEFLASDDASFVTAAAWTVDGGYTAC